LPYLRGVVGPRCPFVAQITQFLAPFVRFVHFDLSQE
jgi:hypothetical protein